jgi:hypothetical protein
MTAETNTSLRSAVRRACEVLARDLGALVPALAGVEGVDRAMGKDSGTDGEERRERTCSTSILLDTTLDQLCTLTRIRSLPAVVATRQTSSSGRPKSPRIQVVLPEELCERLAALAEEESRTVSNMAKVLIQRGVEALEQQRGRQRREVPELAGRQASERQTERFREELERQERSKPPRLRGAPRRIRLRRPLEH